MHIDPETVRLASPRVPRYTSYPTAVQFSPAVGPDTYRAWLGELAFEAKLSAYLHVPFCQQLCFYCGCHTPAERNGDVIGSYVETLRKEIGLVAAALPGRRTLSLGRRHSDRTRQQGARRCGSAMRVQSLGCVANQEPRSTSNRHRRRSGVPVLVRMSAA
jgi:hypothetical protein